MPFGIRKRALVVARTYPVPEESGIESSCTAAITAEGEWLRVFPVPWRLLPKKQRFRKYDWVDLDLVKAENDTRPESHHLRPSSELSIVSSESECQRRKDVVLPVRSHCLCCLGRERDLNQRPTLGIIRPDASPGSALPRIRIPGRTRNSRCCDSSTSLPNPQKRNSKKFPTSSIMSSGVRTRAAPGTL